MRAVQSRCLNIFPGKPPGPAMLYLKTLEKILDFQSDMVCVNKDHFKSVTVEYQRELDGHGR